MVDKLVALHTGEKQKLVDMGDGTHAEQVVSHPPFDLLTDGGDGPNRRLRVDVGQTGFFGGREFRTWKELNLTLGQVYVVKAVVPVDIILFSNIINLTSGEVKMYTSVGGTEGGSFSETLPILARNTMSERPTPIYTPVVTLTAGGTLTGETNIDLVWAKTADNSNFAANVGSGIGEERGVAANTYHFKMTAVIAATGVWSAWWEERLP